MVRGISVVLGIGLVALWIAGLTQHATAWLTWLDVFGALCAFAVAAGAGARVSTGQAGGAVALGAGLGILWILGILSRADRWLTWWTFAFACAFVLVGIGAGVGQRRISHPRPA